MKITDRGQVTIPKRLRERHGLTSDTEVEFREQGHQLVLCKRRTGKRLRSAAVFGILKGRGVRTDKIIDELRGR